MKKMIFLALGLFSSSLCAMETVQRDTSEIDTARDRQSRLNEQLLQAMANHNGKLVAELLEAGADPNTRKPRSRNTMLHIAVRLGLRNIVVKLLQYGANPEAKNGSGQTVFDYAREEKMFNFLCTMTGIKKEWSSRLLTTEKSSQKSEEEKEKSGGIKRKRDDEPDQPSKREKIGSGTSSTSPVEVPGLIPLISIMGYIDVHSPIDGQTALHHFLERGEEVVRALLTMGADINAVDSQGNTVLMRAITMKNESLVRLLLEHGANINAQNPQNGKTALMLVARTGNIPLLTMLISRGAQTALVDSDDKTFIHYLDSEMQAFIGTLLQSEKPSGVI